MFRSWGLVSESEKAYYEKHSISEEYSFLKKAFAANMDIAEAAYNTSFIQSIKADNLSPETYGSVTVLDAYYCYEAAQSIWHACGHADENSELQNALKKFYNSYAKYNGTFYSTWHVPAAQNVVPNNAFQTYAKHERTIAKEDSPIYLLPALMPCYKLWAWMAYKIYQEWNAERGSNKQNVRDEKLYGFWVIGNMGNEGESGSATLADHVIGQWIKDGKEFDEEKALKIFRKSMQCEYEVFSSNGNY